MVVNKPLKVNRAKNPFFQKLFIYAVFCGVCVNMKYMKVLVETNTIRLLFILLNCKSHFTPKHSRLRIQALLSLSIVLFCLVSCTCLRKNALIIIPALCLRGRGFTHMCH